MENVHKKHMQISKNLHQKLSQVLCVYAFFQKPQIIMALLFSGKYSQINNICRLKKTITLSVHLP